MKETTTVVGGGLAGLTCAALLARAGRQVTLLEKSELGGRARTHLEQGALWNLGPHALYRGGHAMRLLRELEVQPVGRPPPASGSLAYWRGELHALPVGAVSLISTSMLTLKEKVELGRILGAVARLEPEGTVGQWLAGAVESPTVAAVIRAAIRVASYVNDEQLPARLAVEQLRLALGAGVLYLDGGWQQLVQALRDRALRAGVQIIERHRATSVEPGTVLAVAPRAAAELLPGRLDVEGLSPVRAACLDLALDDLPYPRRTFALGIDQPLYFSVHSHTARLGPHHVIHVAKYLSAGEQGEAALPELEALCDSMQPGWRRRLLGCRFLPSMAVAHALPGRRWPTPCVDGVFLVGDWIGEGGMLLDAALRSAHHVATQILGPAACAAA